MEENEDVVLDTGVNGSEAKKAKPANESSSSKHNESNQKKRTKALLKWIIDRHEPFCLVNNKSFLEFINILDPKYVVPCRSTVAELIKEEFDIKAEKVRTFLKNYEGKVNITSDGWSSNATDPYVVVTSSLITKEFKLCSFILDFFNFPHPHDAYNIKESIKEVNYLVLIFF